MAQNNNKAKDDIKEAEDKNNYTIAEERTEDNEYNDFASFSKDELITILIKSRQVYAENMAKITEMTVLCKRVQADFDNYRKRNNENLKSVRQDAALDVIEKFLPTLDIVDQALTLIKDEQILGGIRIMRRQLMEVFASYGVTEIESVGEDFNPACHEAIMSEDNPKQAGKVLEVFRKGYRIGDKILRYAAVKVAK